MSQENADRLHAGIDPEKLPDTEIEQLIVNGCEITSRYRKAAEFREMQAALLAVPPDLRRGIAALFCDSKMGNSYTVTLREGRSADWRAIGQGVLDGLELYNFVHVQAADGADLGDVDGGEIDNPLPYRPSPRFERFDVFGNHDGTFHINVVAGDGGYAFADGFNSNEDAEWTAGLLNAAIGARPLPG
jgi:hypothetical protein